MDRFDVRIVARMEEVSASAWNRLVHDDLFTAHEWLSALETTGCAGPEEGWQPQHVTLWQGLRLVGAMPLYLKTNSNGEFRADETCARIWERSGQTYFPKLVSTIPFTAVPSRRLLAAPEVDAETIRTQLLEAALLLAHTTDASSLHFVFPTADEALWLEGRGFTLRTTLLFDWKNTGYRSFDDFMGSLTAKQRRRTRAERSQAARAGYSFQLRKGAELTPQEWALVARCLEQTRQQKGVPSAYTHSFLERIGRSIPSTRVLLGYVHEQPVACGLFFQTPDALFARAWGAVAFVPGLTFEALYQLIQHCIAHGIGRLEGGAGGVHKVLRGFHPSVSWSAHHLLDAGAHAKVEAALRQERENVLQSVETLHAQSPYRSILGHA